MIGVILLTILTVGCSDNDKIDNEPLTVNGMREGIIILSYPDNTFSRISIQGGTYPYSVECKSDILKVRIDEDAPTGFLYEISGVGDANVTVYDAAGDKITVPVRIEYSDISLRVSGFDVEVIGNNLTIAQHEELKEKALNYIPVEENGIYRLVYAGKDSGTLYVHKTAYDAYRYEGTFKKIEPKEESVFGGYEFKFEGNTHNVYWELYSGPSTRKELTPHYSLNEDLTKQFLPEYPGLESLVIKQLF